MIQEPGPLTPVLPENPSSPAPAPRRFGGGMRAVLVGVICLALAVPVIASMAASSTPSKAASGVGASAAPAGTSDPDKGHDGRNGFGVGPGKGFASGGGSRSPGRGPITITAIVGSNVSLKTDDGWSRTIAVTSDTTITKGGQTIKVTDLNVGDEVRFSESRNADKSYTIKSIVVPTPKTAGEVTKVSGDDITLKRHDGSAQVITVTGTTVYTLGRATGSKADVKVGTFLDAEGTVTGTDFTATAIHVRLTNASGEVTAKTTDSITVKHRDGSTTVIHVTTSTKFAVKGKTSAALADIAVGDSVIASGTSNTDGSLDAISVFGGHFSGGFGPKPLTPKASTTPG